MLVECENILTMTTQRSAINEPMVPIDTAAIATKSANHANSEVPVSRRSRNWACSESQRSAA